MITAQNGIYKLDTDNTSYIFRECESGHLQHLYYGRKIHADAQVLCEKHVSIPGKRCKLEISKSSGCFFKKTLFTIEGFCYMI